MPKSLFSFLFFLISISVVSQNNIFCEQLSHLKTLIESSHFTPKTINDSLSNGVHKLFIENLDKNRRLFTQKDIESFKNDKNKIDDFIESNNCNFINQYTTVLKKRINMSKSFINDLSTQELNYSGKDTLYFNADIDFQYFKNDTVAKAYWNKRIRFNILTKLIENDSVYKNIKANFKSLEKEIKPLIIQNEVCLLDEVLNKNGGIDKFVKESFLNAFLKYHDPHSSFFNNSNKVLFENSVANSQLSFGISTNKNNNGDIVISYIAPGSPAFKNINLEVNDIIKSIKCDGVILETYCVSNEDVAAFINEENKETASFKIKKSNGLLLDIELTKKLVEVETNSIRGYLIKNTNTVGYIEIPSFYTDLESPNGLGMANDVAKEMYRLKKENIQGLIIDLRFNGGGSMKEAADLSGMFIDRGPISIIKYHNEEIFTLKDYNRGKAFSKPVVILVNHFSASASELFASAMQDYNRAIIVGTTTHGKSSAQVILPLNENTDLGFAKLTVEKFYRPTGKSHQSIGVIPDIGLPSIYDNFETEEWYSDYALQNDSITPIIKLLPSKALPISNLKSLSSKRISGNNEFKNISSMNDKLLKNYIHKKTQYPLTLDNVHNDINTYKNLWKDFESTLNVSSENFKFTNTVSTNQIIQYSDSEKEDNENILNELSKDVTLKEAHAILLDLINTTH